MKDRPLPPSPVRVRIAIRIERATKDTVETTHLSLSLDDGGDLLRDGGLGLRDGGGAGGGGGGSDGGRGGTDLDANSR